MNAPAGRRGAFPVYRVGLLDTAELEAHRLDPAWGKSAFSIGSGHRFGHDGEWRVAPLEEVHRQLESHRKRFEKGVGFELLQAARLCAEENLPMPRWLAKAFISAVDQLAAVGVEPHSKAAPATIAEVFSTPSPRATGKKAFKDRRDWALGVELWVRAWDIARSSEDITTLDAAIDVALADGQFAYGKTKARALFERVDVNQHELAGTTLLSQFLANRRKSA